MTKFDPKDSLEIVPLTFDFSPELKGQTIVAGTPQVLITVFAGTDPAPDQLISGAASLIGDTVHQNVKGGLAGVDYLVRVTVTTNAGLKFTIGRVLPVRLAGTY